MQAPEELDKACRRGKRSDAAERRAERHTPTVAQLHTQEAAFDEHGAEGRDARARVRC